MTRSRSPFGGTLVSRPDGTPIHVLFQRDSTSDVLDVGGWVNLNTGIFTPGLPPADIVPYAPRGLRGATGATGPGGLSDEPYNVAHYGATPVDIPEPIWNIPAGTPDSSSAIQAAIDDAWSHGGGKVFVPSGFFVGSFKVPPFVSVVGAGRSQTFMHAPTTETVAIVQVETGVYSGTGHSAGPGHASGVRSMALIGNATLGTRSYGPQGIPGEASPPAGTTYGVVGATSGNGTGESGVLILSHGGDTFGNHYASFYDDLIIMRCRQNGFAVNNAVDNLLFRSSWIYWCGRYGVVFGAKDSHALDVVVAGCGVRMGDTPTGAIVGGSAFMLPGGVGPTGSSLANWLTGCWGTESLRSCFLISGLSTRLTGCESVHSPIGIEIISPLSTDAQDQGTNNIPEHVQISNHMCIGTIDPVKITGRVGGDYRPRFIEVEATSVGDATVPRCAVNMAANPDIGTSIKIRTDYAQPITDDYSSIIFSDQIGTSPSPHFPELADLTGVELQFDNWDAEQFFFAAVDRLKPDLAQGRSMTFHLSGDLFVDSPIHREGFLPGTTIKTVFVQDVGGGHVVTLGEAFLSAVTVRSAPKAVTSVKWVNVSKTLAPQWVAFDASNAAATAPPTPTSPDTVAGLIQWNRMEELSALADTANVNTWPHAAGVDLTTATGAAFGGIKNGPSRDQINGHDCVQTGIVGATNRAMSGLLTPSQAEPLTLFIVCGLLTHWNDLNSGGVQYDTVIDSPTAGSELWITGNRENDLMAPKRHSWGVNEGKLVESGVPTDNAAHVFELRVYGPPIAPATKPLAGSATLLLDGAIIAEANIGTQAWSGVQIGRHDVANYSQVGCLVGEIVAFNRVLDATEAAGVRSWLSSRFGIPCAFPGSFDFAPGFA